MIHHDDATVGVLRHHDMHGQTGKQASRKQHCSTHKPSLFDLSPQWTGVVNDPAVDDGLDRRHGPDLFVGNRAFVEEVLR